MKRALGFLAVLVTAMASTPALAVVSVGNVLLRMAEAILIMEENGVQVEEVTIDALSTSKQAHSITAPLEAGHDIWIVGVGDEDRIVNLDLIVLDAQGQELVRDQLDDNTPVLNFTPSYPGTYTIVAMATEMAEGVEDGFFGVAYGHHIGREPVSVADTLLQAALISSKLEEEEYQVVYARWLVVEPKTSVPVPLHLEGPAVYTVVGVGDSDRVKDLDLAVVDAQQNTVGEDVLRDNIPIVEIPASESGTWTAYARAAKMKRRRYKDAHALVLVAREP
ncbi:MAG: hypothetical protein H6741_25770 [Alphaproteobacteria bacterium]|nr:hypothetical protein [Alphaproteobacteria bacterium]MCB9796120.1 hypothetical protein [Alphaproteobacteria bacterium]